MPFDIIDSWPSDPAAALPRGWYRHESGRLHYWDGLAWHGPDPAIAAAGTAVTAEVAEPHATTPAVVSHAVFGVGWIVAIMALGMVLSGVPATAAGAATLIAAVCFLTAVLLRHPVPDRVTKTLGHRAQSTPLWGF